MGTKSSYYCTIYGITIVTLCAYALGTSGYHRTTAAVIDHESCIGIYVNVGSEATNLPQ